MLKKFKSFVISKIWLLNGFQKNKEYKFLSNIHHYYNETLSNLSVVSNQLLTKINLEKVE